MEYETVIIETTDIEMDLGEAQEAYDTYPQTSEAFMATRNEWKKLTEQIMSKDHTTITQREIEKSDALYETLQRLRQEFLDRKTIVYRKLDDLIIEGKELQANLAYYTKDINTDDGIEWAQSLLQEAVADRDNDNPIETIQKAYRARECLETLLGKAKAIWMKKHQEKVDSLRIDEEEVKHG